MVIGQTVQAREHRQMDKWMLLNRLSNSCTVYDNHLVMEPTGIPVTGNPPIVSFIDGHPSIYVLKHV